MATVMYSRIDGRIVAENRGGTRMSENTFYVWKRRYAGMEAEDVRKLRELER
ncbi:MAG: hypothetical protein H6534_06490 [Chthonomonadaceae bacterium]|nr:hypothetical protein [Chthonomonadaceae bacterium]